MYCHHHHRMYIQRQKFIWGAFRLNFFWQQELFKRAMGAQWCEYALESIIVSVFNWIENPYYFWLIPKLHSIINTLKIKLIPTWNHPHTAAWLLFFFFLCCHTIFFCEFLFFVYLQLSSKNATELFTFYFLIFFYSLHFLVKFFPITKNIFSIHF